MHRGCTQWSGIWFWDDHGKWTVVQPVRVVRLDKGDIWGMALDCFVCWVVIPFSPPEIRALGGAVSPRVFKASENMVIK